MQTPFVEFMGSLCAIFFFAGIAYYCATSNAAPIDDFFVIGYLEQPTQQLVQPLDSVDAELKRDCIDTLVKLGMKKRTANKIAKDVFSKPNPPSTIQEFLKEAL